MGFIECTIIYYIYTNYYRYELSIIFYFHYYALDVGVTP